MRVDPLQTIQKQFHPQKIQEDKGREAPKEPTTTSSEADKVTLSTDAHNLQRFAALTASEQIDNVGIDAERQALIRQRIASGYYNRPEVEQDMVDRVVHFFYR